MKSHWRQLLHNMYNSKIHFSKEFVEMCNNSFYCSYSALCSCTYCGGQYQNTFCWVFQNKFAWAGILQAVFSPEVQLGEIHRVKFQKQETGKPHPVSCALRIVRRLSKVDLHQCGHLHRSIHSEFSICVLEIIMLCGRTVTGRGIRII